MWGEGANFSWRRRGGGLYALLEAFLLGVLGFCKLSQPQTLNCFGAAVATRQWPLLETAQEADSGFFLVL